MMPSGTSNPGTSREVARGSRLRGRPCAPRPCACADPAHAVLRCDAKLVPARFRYAAALFPRPAGLHAGPLALGPRKTRAAGRRSRHPRRADPVRRPVRPAYHPCNSACGPPDARAGTRFAAQRCTSTLRGGGRASAVSPPVPPLGGGLTPLRRSRGLSFRGSEWEPGLCGFPPVPPDGGGGFPPRPPPRGGAGALRGRRGGAPSPSPRSACRSSDKGPRLPRPAGVWPGRGGVAPGPPAGRPGLRVLLLT